jgi:hypothetical protein
MKPVRAAAGLYDVQFSVRYGSGWTSIGNEAITVR